VPLGAFQPAGCFQLLAQSLNFLLEPANLPPVFFDLVLGALPLLRGNELKWIRLPFVLLLVCSECHPPYGNPKRRILFIPTRNDLILFGFKRGNKIRFKSRRAIIYLPDGDN
jgi:hypothetical protein